MGSRIRRSDSMRSIIRLTQRGRGWHHQWGRGRKSGNHNCTIIKTQNPGRTDMYYQMIEEGLNKMIGEHWKITMNIRRNSMKESFINLKMWKSLIHWKQSVTIDNKMNWTKIRITLLYLDPWHQIQSLIVLLMEF